MYEQYRPQRAGMIAEFDARLVEVRRQAELEGARYTRQVQLREVEIQRLN